jgi:hypothetical protein
MPADWRQGFAGGHIMNGKYVTVKCPVCNNVSQLKATGIRTEIFRCPVCLDGEIEYREQKSVIYRIGAEYLVELPELVTI